MDTVVVEKKLKETVVTDIAVLSNSNIKKEYEKLEKWKGNWKGQASRLIKPSDCERKKLEELLQQIQDNITTVKKSAELGRRSEFELN